MELLEVLNENVELTGEILDKSIIHREGKYHKEVALILLNDKGEILLQKRLSTKELNQINRLGMEATLLQERQV